MAPFGTKPKYSNTDMSLHALPAGQELPLHDEAGSCLAEAKALAAHPNHTLMAQAGASLARLAMALAPHGRLFWVACGPGNNGGDGLIAALKLHQAGRAVWISREASAPRPGSDAAWALQTCQAAGLPVHAVPPSGPWDLAVDALYGLGARPGLPALHAKWLGLMRRSTAPLLCADVPTGLQAGTGLWCAPPQDLLRPPDLTHTLSLLTLKTGLFTGAGRDAAGRVWWDDLGHPDWAQFATARLLGAPPHAVPRHDSHKGHGGTVWVIGGDAGMAGAAWQAGQSALRRGAGRVHVYLLAPELAPAARPLALMTASAIADLADETTVVAGCGGGHAIGSVLPRLLSRTSRLVLDADALNAISADSGLQTLLKQRGSRPVHTVLTPHPLEAARLLGCTASEVQADRLAAARKLSVWAGAVVVLKGSGSIVAHPDGRMAINPSGNQRLATAGSGDVLAGWIGARLALGEPAWDGSCAAVYLHGLQAEQGPADKPLIADDQ